MSRILFVGPLWVGSTSLQRMLGLRALGIEVEAIDTSPPGEHRLAAVGARIGKRLGVDYDLARANSQILDAVARSVPAMLWVEKGLTIRPAVLSRLKRSHPEISLVSYSPDDMILPANQSQSYLQAIPLYDCHVTHKSFNVSELKALGAKRVYYTAKSFDDQSYYPRELTAAEAERWGADVAFLGGYEKERFDVMLALARMGVPIRIWGPGWEKAADAHPNLDVRAGWVQAEDAAKVFCATKVNLHFLRKVARDLHTARSVEIPACMAFMLAERTSEHLELFDEGREAEYFADVDELRYKIDAYLQDAGRRAAIAEAGYRRCLSSGYSNRQRLRTILDALSFPARLPARRSPSTTQRLVFVGPLWIGSTTRQRMLGFRKLGIETDPVDTTLLEGQVLGSVRAALARRVGIDADVAGANARMVEAADRSAPDLVWVEKGLTIKPRALRRIKKSHPGVPLVSYSPDDQILPANQSRSYVRSIPIYDWHVTHKSFNVDELKALGARNVYYTPQSFDDQSYFPRELTAADREKWGADVAFLGGFEKERFEAMLMLARMGILIRIWGPGWEDVVSAHPNLDVRSGWIQAEDAAKVFCATKVNLHFLRKVARDLHTTRSVEIPACRAFMLAERTTEHLELFEEGREAEFFDDIEELARKLAAYLRDDERRAAVAEAGYQRCLSAGYSNERRLQEILAVVRA